MNIIRGTIPGPQKVVIYGPEGIGKSTLASHFPGAIFIDTEGSTKKLNVARFEAPSSWNMLLSQVDYVISNPSGFKTLIIDTADWAQTLCIRHVCDKSQVSGIESFGYGKGYVYVAEEFGKLLNKLDDVIQTGLNVVLTAHAQIVKFEQPDEMGAYDRWSMKLLNSKMSISSMVKEWADMVLFCNYETYSVAVDEKGKKHKAQGGRRVMYTTHHPCWDAKNRDGLPDKIPMDYEEIRSIIEANNGPAPLPSYLPEPEPEPAPVPQPEPEPEELPFISGNPEGMDVTPNDLPLPAGIPKALADLMRANNVGEWDIQAVCAQRGYYPEDTPIANYDTDFINGCLVAAWPQVFQMIQERRAEFDNDNPFKQ